MFIPADVTVLDFKIKFRRDFDYLPVWLSSLVYNTGAVVYYETTQLFYTCKNIGVSSVPTTSLDWDVNDPQPSVEDYILDSDIQRALDESQLIFNKRLLQSDEMLKTFYLYLSAHILYNNLKLGGLNGSPTAQYLTNSRSVGSVSESYNVPDWMLKDPFSFYATSPYGIKYISLIKPYLFGMSVAYGTTQP